MDILSQAAALGDARVRQAAERFSLTPVVSSDSAPFALAYDLLAAEFGPRGELERRPVLAAWVDGRRVTAPPIESRYHLLLAWDRDGAPAAARDLHVTVDADAGIVVVYLAHVLVLPAFRRSGLGGLLRLVPLALGRQALRAIRPPRNSGEVLLAAEMEPLDPRQPDTVVRLTAYGRAGFQVVSPAVLGYQQPDFTAPETRQAPRPLPLWLVVLRDGHAPQRSLPKPLAAALVRHLYAVFATHCPATELAPLEAAMLHQLQAHPADALPLIPPS